MTERIGPAGPNRDAAERPAVDVAGVDGVGGVGGVDRVDGVDGAIGLDGPVGAVGMGGVDGVDGLDEADVPRRGRTGLIVSIVVALLSAGFVAVLATRQPATDRQAESPLIGKVTPALSGETLDGGSFDIDDHQGRWVVVNFFATWCLPCRREHPELVRFDEAHRRTGDAQLVSVIYDDSPRLAAEYFADNGGEWPVVLDVDGGIATRYGVPKVPETYVVDPGGRVRAKLLGGVTRDGLERVIDDMARADAAAAGTGSGGGA